MGRSPASFSNFDLLCVCHSTRLINFTFQLLMGLQLIWWHAKFETPTLLNQPEMKGHACICMCTLLFGTKVLSDLIYSQLLDPLVSLAITLVKLWWGKTMVNHPPRRETPLSLSSRASQALILLGAPLVLFHVCNSIRIIYYRLESSSSKPLPLCAIVFYRLWSWWKPWLSFELAKSPLHWLCGGEYPADTIVPGWSLRFFQGGWLTPIGGFSPNPACQIHSGAEDLVNVDLFSGAGAINSAFRGGPDWKKTNQKWLF